MKNQVYNVALTQASRLIGKRARLLKLVPALLHRVSTLDKRQRSIAGIKEHVLTLIRLVKSFALGKYRAIPYKTMVAIVAGLLYFINPLDLVPDAIVGLGFVDDLMVLTWVYRMAQKEVDRFIAWEAAMAQHKLDALS